ncbi:hypothetical protein E4U11_002482 [Claviceps purpurea]|nr:hypothetical protein E4U11_002482 [Claviceps purpurea]
MCIVEFKFHDNNGETKTKPRKSTKASGRSSIPDTYCRVFASLEGSQLLLIVEYKAPHKLKRRMVKAALASMADMNLDGDVTRTHRQEQIIIAAVITQAFAAMVRCAKGSDMGMLTPGKS